MKIRYNSIKNVNLKIERGVNFNDIENAIHADCLLDIESHHNQDRYSNQIIMHVRINDEVYSAPFVIEADGTLFLKTVYANRKARKKFLKPKGKT